MASGVGALPAIAVFQPNNINFAKVVTRRHFDDVHCFIEGVRHTMHGTNRDAGRLVDSQVKLPVIQGEARLAANTLGTPAAATIILPIVRLLSFSQGFCKPLCFRPARKRLAGLQKFLNDRGGLGILTGGGQCACQVKLNLGIIGRLLDRQA